MFTLICNNNMFIYIYIYIYIYKHIILMSFHIFCDFMKNSKIYIYKNAVNETFQMGILFIKKCGSVKY